MILKTLFCAFILMMGIVSTKEESSDSSSDFSDSEETYQLMKEYNKYLSKKRIQTVKDKYRYDMQEDYKKEAAQYDNLLKNLKNMYGETLKKPPPMLKKFN
ncbi:uncharacterized protein isoform X1 [Choristoneura fumiferana]|uniref:uncharacterized protein isoform X1 n=1 Tax=Choristoneura fumiferana TaxID=7141 RepID=UPI003D15E837